MIEPRPPPFTPHTGSPHHVLQNRITRESPDSSRLGGVAIRICNARLKRERETFSGAFRTKTLEKSEGNARECRISARPRGVKLSTRTRAKMTRSPHAFFSSRGICLIRPAPRRPGLHFSPGVWRRVRRGKTIELVANERAFE